ncbi:hypothetical protein SMIR_36465 [Streptomyces mirabilis]|uniref:hypothetical protein n=1 Tax=Streptomyces mirabilis TaxID=68239 RepID=UPI001BAF5734|nr:hypothetical protein [Streptomyces mirabilis]QUW83979.1 hypothetical protein SMIR_36465 [Streptomyces mirabilis]
MKVRNLNSRVVLVTGTDPYGRSGRAQKMYERRGYPPERVAVNILRAVGGNHAVAPEAHLMYGLTCISSPAARRSD